MSLLVIWEHGGEWGEGDVGGDKEGVGVPGSWFWGPSAGIWGLKAGIWGLQC